MQLQLWCWRHQQKPLAEWTLYMPPHVWWSCRLFWTPHLGRQWSEWEQDNYQWSRVCRSTYPYGIAGMPGSRQSTASCCSKHDYARRKFDQWTRIIHLVGSLISVISGCLLDTEFLVSVEHNVYITGFNMVDCDDGRSWGKFWIVSRVGNDMTFSTAHPSKKCASTLACLGASSTFRLLLK